MATLSLYWRDTSPSPEKRHGIEVSIEVSDHGRNSDSGPLLIPTCVTEKELDDEVDRLMDRIRQLQRDAKAKLSQNV